MFSTLKRKDAILPMDTVERARKTENLALSICQGPFYFKVMCPFLIYIHIACCSPEAMLHFPQMVSKLLSYLRVRPPDLRSA